MGIGDDIMRSAPQDGWYITKRTPERWYFRPDFKVRPGRLGVLPDKRSEGYVIVEPHIKATTHDNKDWGWSRWQELARRTSYPLMQFDYGKPILNGVQGIETTIHQAFALLASSRGIVTTEGGLHHAAGALGKPAVVIFGAFNSPENFGYDHHVNLHEPDPEGLGQRRPDPACREAMNRITVDAVLRAMDDAFGTVFQKASAS